MGSKILDKDAWFEARRELHEEEKAFTRARAALAEKRRALPKVLIEQDYRFTGPEGEVSLVDLFGDASQLAIYHMMFGPGWEKPCPGCSQWASAIDGVFKDVQRADARVIVVSRAPFDEIAPMAEKLDWRFDWYSAYGSSFNYDFYASSEDLGKDASETIPGTGEVVYFDRGENHCVNVFEKGDAGEVFLTYSVFNRGIEELNSAFGYYDILPKGRAW